MTKQSEIELLDGFIAALGKNSYLGPWLASNRDSIVADIRNDFPVTGVLFPAEAERQAAQIRQDAVDYARGYRETAIAEAEKLKDAARAYAMGVRNDMARTLARAIDTLHGS